MVQVHSHHVGVTTLVTLTSGVRKDAGWFTLCIYDLLVYLYPIFCDGFDSVPKYLTHTSGIVLSYLFVCFRSMNVKVAKRFSKTEDICWIMYGMIVGRYMCARSAEDNSNRK